VLDSLNILIMIRRILRSSFRPYTIIYPFPLLPLITGAFADGIYGLWKPVIFTFLFYPANNLWNHINDAEDDFRGGKDTPFIHNKARKLATLIAATLYSLSALFVLLFSESEVSIILFLLVFAVTFAYSDRTVTGLRLKKHYITEFSVYSIAVPSYIILMYSLVKNPDIRSLKIAILFTPLMLSTLFLKDLKDITSDRGAGLTTFGVVFHYKTLLKTFYSFLLIYFILGICFFLNSIISMAFLPIVGVMYSAFRMMSHNWEASEKTQKYINYSIASGLISVIATLAITLSFSLLRI